VVDALKIIGGSTSDTLTAKERIASVILEQIKREGFR
jgi:hypothetical protein